MAKPQRGLRKGGSAGQGLTRRRGRPEAVGARLCHSPALASGSRAAPSQPAWQPPPEVTDAAPDAPHGDGRGREAEAPAVKDCGPAPRLPSLPTSAGAGPPSARRREPGAPPLPTPTQRPGCGATPAPRHPLPAPPARPPSPASGRAAALPAGPGTASMLLTWRPPGCYGAASPRPPGPRPEPGVWEEEKREGRAARQRRVGASTRGLEGASTRGRRARALLCAPAAGK